MKDDITIAEDYTIPFLAMFCMTIFAFSLCLWAFFNFGTALLGCALLNYVITRLGVSMSSDDA